MTVIDREPRERSASAAAHQNCCLLRIARSDLHTRFEHDHRLGFSVMQNILRYVSEQMRHANQKILFLVSAGMFSWLLVATKTRLHFPARPD